MYRGCLCTRVIRLNSRDGFGSKAKDMFQDRRTSIFDICAPIAPHSGCWYGRQEQGQAGRQPYAFNCLMRMRLQPCVFEVQLASTLLPRIGTPSLHSHYHQWNKQLQGSRAGCTKVWQLAMVPMVARVTTMTIPIKPAGSSDNWMLMLHATFQFHCC